MTPPREHPYSERRHRRRREDDNARDTIVENAVHDAPIVNRLVKASDRITKIGGAAMLIGSLIGGLAVALGIRVVGPRDMQAETAARVAINSARIDSLVTAINALRITVKDLARATENISSVECSRLARENRTAHDVVCKPAGTQ